MKTLIQGLGIGLWSCLLAHSQEVPLIDYSQQKARRLNTATTSITSFKPHNNPDIQGNPLSNMNWLQDFSTLLIRNITYPVRGHAYQITGKMYVKFGIDAKGNVHALAFEQSLGTDFDQAIKEALLKISHIKISPPALPLTGYLHFYLPVHFKG